MPRWFLAAVALLATLLTASEVVGQPCLVPTTMGLRLDGDGILVVHHDATYNCCMDISYVLTRDGMRLILAETENPPGGQCDCICCYQLAVRIADVPAGTWTVVLRGVGFELTGSIVVPGGKCDGPILGGRGQSPCGGAEVVGIDSPASSWGGLKARYGRER